MQATAKSCNKAAALSQHRDRISSQFTDSGDRFTPCKAGDMCWGSGTDGVLWLGIDVTDLQIDELACDRPLGKLVYGTPSYIGSGGGLDCLVNILLFTHPYQSVGNSIHPIRI